MTVGWWDHHRWDYITPPGHGHKPYVLVEKQSWFFLSWKKYFVDCKRKTWFFTSYCPSYHRNHFGAKDPTDIRYCIFTPPKKPKWFGQRKLHYRKFDGGFDGLSDGFIAAVCGWRQVVNSFGGRLWTATVARCGRQWLWMGSHSPDMRIYV